MLRWNNLLKVVKLMNNRANCAASKTKIIDFNDTELCYSSKTNGEILRALMVLRLCSFNQLVNHHKFITKWAERILGKRIFEYFMKKTFYGQFVAGENEVAVKKVMSKNREYGVKAIVDYSVEEDVSENEAVELAKHCLEETLVPPPEENVLDIRYQAYLEFADRSKDVTGARTYFYTSEDHCNRHLEETLKSIELMSKISLPNEGFVAIKISGLGRPQLLLHLSEMLVEMENIFYILSEKETKENPSIPYPFRSFDLQSFRERLADFDVKISFDEQSHWFTLMDTNKDQFVDLFEWSNLIYFRRNLASLFKMKNKETGEWTPVVSTLTEDGLESMRLMLQRLDTVAKFAKEKGIRVIVDAEQSYFQPAIRRLALEMMKRFNRDSVLVLNTYQCYLKNALRQVVDDLYYSKKENFHIGLKLVRGAYMDQERTRAKAKGYEDPILPNFEATSDMYNAAFDTVLKEVLVRPPTTVGVMVATHNEETILHVIEKMKEFNIAPDAKVVCFGQLLGMCDHISFTLGMKGYSIYKVLPYGPMHDVMPYLMRRALENRSIFKKVQRQRELLRKELWRRLRS